MVYRDTACLGILRPVDISVVIIYHVHEPLCSHLKSRLLTATNRGLTVGRTPASLALILARRAPVIIRDPRAAPGGVLATTARRVRPDAVSSAFLTRHPPIANRARPAQP